LFYESSLEQVTVRSLSAGSTPAMSNNVFINPIQSESEVRMENKKLRLELGSKWVIGLSVALMLDMYGVYLTRSNVILSLY
jgi:hypothetical protein